MEFKNVDDWTPLSHSSRLRPLGDERDLQPTGDLVAAPWAVTATVGAVTATVGAVTQIAHLSPLRCDPWPPQGIACTTATTSTCYVSTSSLESVDPIFDPPFNSNRTHNVLFKAHSGEESQAQIEAFDYSWELVSAGRGPVRGADRRRCPDQGGRRRRGDEELLGDNDVLATW